LFIDREGGSYAKEDRKLSAFLHLLRSRWDHIMLLDLKLEEYWEMGRSGDLINAIAKVIKFLKLDGNYNK